MVDHRARSALDGRVSTTPLSPALTMTLAGLAGFGLLSYRRKKMGVAVA